MIGLLGDRIENGRQRLTQCLERFVELATDVLSRLKRFVQDLFLVLLFDGDQDPLARFVKGAAAPFAGAKRRGKAAYENPARDAG